MEDKPTGEGTWQNLLLASTTHRDQAIDRIARSVENLALDFGRKLDDVERDTGKRLESFNANVASQFQSITTKFEAAMAARDAKFEAFSTKVLESGRAPWALLLTGISVAVLIMGAIGGLAYAPISQRTENIERAIDKIVDNQLTMREFMSSNFVTQKELEFRSQRGQEDRERTDRAIENIQANIFTRDVHKQHWDNIDTEIKSTNERVDLTRQEMQRQIDNIQKNLGDTYTARDALLDNKQRIQRLEDLVRQFTSNRVTP